MGPLKNPPPVRRIVVDDEPTIVEPPKRRNGAAPDRQGRRLRPAQRAAQARGQARQGQERMRTEELGVAYAGKPAVKGVNLPVSEGEVLGADRPLGVRQDDPAALPQPPRRPDPDGDPQRAIYLDDEDVDLLDVTELRRKVGMVFQQPNPFPMSVFDNVGYGLRERGSRRPSRAALRPAVEEALDRAGLLEEVKDNLNHPALRLSGGQQQRLCIARSLAVNPEVLLLDEPCSALDPRSTTIIEELIMKLRSEIAIVIVTHNLQQAYRVADRVGFMYLGDLVEYGEADQVFSAPKAKRTREYVSGGFG